MRVVKEGEDVFIEFTDFNELREVFKEVIEGVEGEGTPLIFDLCVLGFYKWSKDRLRLLGYNPIPSPYRYDDQIITFAKTIGGIIVTTDKGFSKYEKSIILKPDKYEKMYAQLVERLKNIQFQ